MRIKTLYGSFLAFLASFLSFSNDQTHCLAFGCHSFTSLGPMAVSLQGTCRQKRQESRQLTPLQRWTCDFLKGVPER